MPVKKVTSNKKQVTRKTTRQPGLSVSVYSLAGRAAGTLVLPKEVFGAKPNKTLLAQAIRVYTTNQKIHTASTKTRGEVRGSTAKIFRQKGTGRARHGSIRAPIFVGGGVVFGPKPRKVRLSLPKKMKKKALLSALSAKMSEKQIVGVAGLERATGKTKQFNKLTQKIGKSILIVTGNKQNKMIQATRNIPGLSVLPVNQLNAYEVLKHKILLITKDALESLTK